MFRCVCLCASRSAAIFLFSSNHHLFTHSPHTYTHTHISTQFLAKTGNKSLEVKEKGLDKAAGDLMRKLCEKYDNLLEVDKLAAVMNKVDSVKLVLQENVQVALANCVTLENIEKAAGACVCLFCMCMCERFFPCARFLATSSLTQSSLRSPKHTHTHTLPQRTSKHKQACSRRTPQLSRSRCGGSNSEYVRVSLCLCICVCNSSCLCDINEVLSSLPPIH